MAKTISIAIDGPAGAGKSTIARRLAKELGYYYVDTGAIYRTVAYFFDLWGVAPKDIDGITRYIDELTVGIEYDEDGLQHMIMNGMDVTEDIRTQEIGQKASLISAHAIVREMLLDMQQDVAKKHNVIMDGRDIGTVVLPKATVKIFLTASAEVRAKRRTDELVAKGQKADYNKVLKEIPVFNGSVDFTYKEDQEPVVLADTEAIQKEIYNMTAGEGTNKAWFTPHEARLNFIITLSDPFIIIDDLIDDNHREEPLWWNFWIEGALQQEGIAPVIMLSHDPITFNAGVDGWEEGNEYNLPL